jgi:diguanylate cyclase (GGDEF)-like protein
MDTSGTDQDIASPGPCRRALQRLSGQQRIWVLVGTLIALDVVVAALLLGTDGLQGSRPTAWLLIPCFAAAEVFVFHLQYRRNAYSFALSEVALVIGLVFASPLQLTASQVVGVAAALALHRRQSLHKLLFNLSQFALMTMVAATLFHALVPAPGVFGPRLWAGALVAVVLATTGTALLTFAAMSVAEASLQLAGIRTALVGTVVLGLTTTSLGLVAVALLHATPAATLLLFVPIAISYGAYRAYLDERANHERLDFLYRATQSVAAAPDVESAVNGLLTQMRTMFRADIAELTLFPSRDSDPALRTRIGPADARTVMEPLPHIAGVDIAETVFLPAPASPELLAELFGGSVHKDAMAVALICDGRVLGQLALAERLGDVTTFDEADLQLFRALGTQASLALENGRLEKSLDQLSQLKERLRHDAYHDSLTGLPNRSLLLSEVEEAATEAERGGPPAAVMLLDIDDFKTINDSLGHGAGDMVLVEIAERVRASLRPGDLAARLGGDEFAILLRASTGLDAADVADRVLAALGRPLALQGREVIVHASLGIASLTGAVDSSEVLRNADAAMYSAKQAGKNRYALFEQDMHSEAVRRLELRGALQRALERGEFVLHYQPLVDLRTGEVADAEALLRWNRPDEGLVGPDSFIELAEETGQIVPIGRWVLQTAVQQLATWQRTLSGAEDLRISVNLSARQLTAPDLIEDVRGALDSSGLRPEHLVLEITESVLMDDVDAALRTLYALKALGIGLALDDFGTGYSSLSYLRTFPIDVLKLSKPFVDDLQSVGGDALVAAIAGLARALKMRTVAEGIEQSEQADTLRDLGYDIGQGYLFSRPVSAAGFAVLAVEQPFRRDPRERARLFVAQ